MWCLAPCSGHHDCTRKTQRPNTMSRNDPMEDEVFAEDASTYSSTVVPMPVNNNEN